MTKVIPFLALTTAALLVVIAPYQHIFLWIAPYIAEPDVIAANGAKTFFAKGTATFIDGPAYLPKKAPTNPTD